MNGKNKVWNKRVAISPQLLPGDVTTTLESIKHLATKDSIVTIASGDRGTEYDLLQVTGDGPEVLSIEETDDWGSTYPPGAEILRG